jgi:hypothetical protein
LVIALIQARKKQTADSKQQTANSKADGSEYAVGPFAVCCLLFAVCCLLFAIFYRLYKLFMNSLHHFYIQGRNLSLLTICLPKLLTDADALRGAARGNQASRHGGTRGAS